MTNDFFMKRIKEILLILSLMFSFYAFSQKFSLVDPYLGGGLSKVADELKVSGVDVNAPSYREGTDFLKASKNGQEGIVELMLESGFIDVNKQEEKGFKTALIYASKLGHQGVVDVLLKYAARRDLKDKTGKKAIDYARENGHEGIVKTLELPKDFKEFIEATKVGNTQAVRDFIQRGGDVNKVDEQGYRGLHHAFHHAYTYRKFDMVKLLIHSGADVNATDSSKETFLMWASSEKHLGIVKLLVEKGADVNATDIARGQTALMYVALGHGLDSIAKFLIEKGADVNAKDYAGKKAIDHARRTERSSLVKILEKQMNIDTCKKL